MSLRTKASAILSQARELHKDKLASIDAISENVYGKYKSQRGIISCDKVVDKYSGVNSIQAAEDYLYLLSEQKK